MLPIKKFKVKSNSRPIEHTVTQWPSGYVTCTCEHFTYRQTPCKHINSLYEELWEAMKEFRALVDRVGKNIDQKYKEAQEWLKTRPVR